MFDISGRVRALRKEIGELKLANQIPKHSNAPVEVGERQRREARLRDIQAELTELLGRLKGA